MAAAFSSRTGDFSRRLSGRCRFLDYGVTERSIARREFAWICDRFLLSARRSAADDRTVDG